MVADDLGIDGVDPEAEEPAEGSLLKWTTIDGYISAIAELHGLQRSLGTNPYPVFRGTALNNLLDSRRRT